MTVTSYFMKGLAFGLFVSSLALAQKSIRVEGARYRPVQIAVADMQMGENADELRLLAKDLVQRVRDDLDLSSVFHVINPKSYLADPQKEAMDKTKIRITDWTSVGAEALIKMRIDSQAPTTKQASTDVKSTTASSASRVSLMIVPLGILSSSTTKSYRTDAAHWRETAHQISDDIFRYFTGEPGMFSSKIIATKVIAGMKQIVKMDFDGFGEKQLTDKPFIHMLPSVAPDGVDVLFTSYASGNPDLYQMNINGSGIKRISARRGLNIEGQVSPDGKKIAATLSFERNSDIYLMDRDGQNLQRLTFDLAIDTSPSWSSDGKKIAFVSSRSGNPHVYIMNADGTEQKRLTFQGKYNQTPRLSPKGDYLTFMGRDEENVFDIFVLDMKTLKISRVTQNQGHNEDPAFTGNGRLIIFTSTRDGTRDLYVSNLDGSFQKRLTRGGNYFTPAVGPAS